MRTIDIAGRNLIIALLDAETGQRGFIITDDDHYLDPYYAGLSAIPLRMGALRRAAQDTEQAKRVEDIATLTQQKLDELAYTINLRRTDGFQKTAEVIDRSLGKNFMDSIRQHVDEVQLWSDQRYRVTEGEAVWYARIGFITMLLTLASGFFVAMRDWR